MKVIVLKDDGNFYKTWAGAIYYNGWKTEVFLLNEDDEFERVYEYKQNKKSIEKRVFWYDADITSLYYVENGNYAGYKQFVNNKKILDKIRKGGKNIFSREDMIFYESCKYSSDFIKIVDDRYSCRLLYNFTGGFHDAVINKYEYDDKNKKLRIELNGVWGIETLILYFEEVSKYHIEDDYEYGYFYDGSLFIEDDEVCFANVSCNSKSDIDDGWTFVYAKKLRFEYIFKKTKND